MPRSVVPPTSVSRYDQQRRTQVVADGKSRAQWMVGAGAESGLATSASHAYMYAALFPTVALSDPARLTVQNRLPKMNRDKRFKNVSEKSR